jgi:hypothetical protein
MQQQCTILKNDSLSRPSCSRREAQNEAASVLQHVGSWRQSLSVARIDVDLVEQSSKKLETATQNQEKLGAYVKVG